MQCPVFFVGDRCEVSWINSSQVYLDFSYIQIISNVILWIVLSVSVYVLEFQQTSKPKKDKNLIYTIHTFFWFGCLVRVLLWVLHLSIKPDSSKAVTFFIFLFDVGGIHLTVGAAYMTILSIIWKTAFGWSVFRVMAIPFILTWYFMAFAVASVGVIDEADVLEANLVQYLIIIFMDIIALAVYLIACHRLFSSFNELKSKTKSVKMIFLALSLGIFVLCSKIAETTWFSSQFNLLSSLDGYIMLLLYTNFSAEASTALYYVIRFASYMKEVPKLSLETAPSSQNIVC